jgi:hypothetical protein
MFSILDKVDVSPTEISDSGVPRIDLLEDKYPVKIKSSHAKRITLSLVLVLLGFFAFALCVSALIYYLSMQNE